MSKNTGYDAKMIDMADAMVQHESTLRAVDQVIGRPLIRLLRLVRLLWIMSMYAIND